MGFRVRRSFKIAPGVRLNVSSKSVGLSAGVRGARISVNSKGRVTRTVGIPGTGISHTTSSSSRSTARRTSARPSTAPAQPAKPRNIKPSLFAPAWEKRLYKQLSGTADATTLSAISQESADAAPTAAMIEVLRVAVPQTDNERTRTLLAWLHSIGYDPAADPFITKYLGVIEVTVPIATGVTASLPWDRQSIGLVLAELEQNAGYLARAIAVVESLEPTTIAAVSLAELYAETERWDEIVDMTNGLSNEDIASTFLLIQRGTAFREQGHYEAARESLKEALRIRSRPTELRLLAWIARGQTYRAEGKKAMARKDFERVLAEDASYPGLGELLESVAA